MPEYEVSSSAAGRTVYNGEDVVASFTQSPEGDAAFHAFVAGVCSMRGSVWDRSTAQYLTGDVGQLVEGR